MKTLEQNWTWIFVIGMPFLVRSINLARNVLAPAVSIPTNGLSVKKRYRLEDDRQPGRRKIHENIEHLPQSTIALSKYRWHRFEQKLT
jgi:hypothetical protein